MLNLYSILRKPIITKKTSILLKNNKITFEVDKKTNKNRIKKTFKILFNIERIRVRIIILRGKLKRMGKSFGRTKTRKKAIITLNKQYNAKQFILHEK